MIQTLKCILIFLDTRRLAKHKLIATFLPQYLSRITNFICRFVLSQPPWPDCDNNFVIMFKVGEGATPAIPETLSEEGQDFLLCCFLHDPYERHTANQLMDHSFVKVQLSNTVKPPVSYMYHPKCHAYVVAYGRCAYELRFTLSCHLADNLPLNLF